MEHPKQNFRDQTIPEIETSNHQKAGFKAPADNFASQHNSGRRKFDNVHWSKQSTEENNILALKIRIVSTSANSAWQRHPAAPAEGAADRHTSSWHHKLLHIDMYIPRTKSFGQLAHILPFGESYSTASRQLGSGLSQQRLLARRSWKNRRHDSTISWP